MSFDWSKAGVTIRFEDVQSAALRGQPWRENSELPDVLGYDDITCRPDLAASAIEHRIAQGNVHGSPRAFPYPKPSGAGLRHFTYLDPFAELLYRHLVGRGVPAIEAALSPEVIRTRSRRFRSGAWATRPVKVAFPVRAEHQERGRGAVPKGGEGMLDVKSYYPSLRWSKLSAVLHSVGLTSPQVESILGYLQDLVRIRGIPDGLPLGPEASAPLGTVALIDVDRVLLRQNALFSRWADDLTLWVPSEQQFNRLVDDITGQLGLGGQTLNVAKTRYDPLFSGQPLRGSDDLWLSGVDELDSKPGSPLDGALIEYLLGVDDWVDSLPRWLGQLRHRRKPAAIGPLLGQPWVIFRYPKQTARYFSELSHAVPWGDVTELVLSSPVDEETAGGVLHLTKAIPRKHLGSDASRRMVDRALTLDPRRFAPVRDQLLHAAAGSKEKVRSRRERALDLTVEYAETNLRRAALSAFQAEPIKRVHQRELRRLAAGNPDLSPTVEWVCAA